MSSTNVRGRCSPVLPPLARPAGCAVSDRVLTGDLGAAGTAALVARCALLLPTSSARMLPCRPFASPSSRSCSQAPTLSDAAGTIADAARLAAAEPCSKSCARFVAPAACADAGLRALVGGLNHCAAAGCSVVAGATAGGAVTRVRVGAAVRGLAARRLSTARLNVALALTGRGCGCSECALLHVSRAAGGAAMRDTTSCIARGQHGRRTQNCTAQLLTWRHCCSPGKRT